MVLFKKLRMFLFLFVLASDNFCIWIDAEHVYLQVLWEDEVPQ